MTLPLIGFAVAFLVGYFRTPEEDGFWNRATGGLLTGFVVLLILSAITFTFLGGDRDLSNFNTR